MTFKDRIVEIAHSLGFQRTVIGGLAPMDAERVEFEAWLAKGYAAGMEYLKRNPHFRASPQLLYPEAKSAIVVAASYYTEPPPSPGPGYGRVARYAVGLDYHTVLRDKLNEFKSKLETEFGRTFLGKAYTDDVALLEQAYASRSGLGFSGKNTMVIGPKLMGSFNFVAELFTDLELAEDEPYQGTCGKCFRCGDICPTDAIVYSGETGGEVNAGLCISYLTIENKGGVPLELRSKLGDWVFGCDLCQEVCPYNQRPPRTPWKEFHPESGVGHHLDLFSLLEIKTESEFRKKFANTPLLRPKRKGLLRNALVVIGNQKPDHAIDKLFDFAMTESNPMLREHAAWALMQLDSDAAKKAVEQIYKQETELEVHGQIQVLLDR